VTIHTVKVGVAHCVTPHRQDASCWIFAEAIAGFTVHAHIAATLKYGIMGHSQSKFYKHIITNYGRK